MGKVIWTVWTAIIILFAIVWAINSHAQVTQGTVFSKTLDGVGTKITSTVSGADIGLDVNCLNCGAGGATYLDADGIANQTASAVHGQTYMYNGATWDRVRGSIAGGLEVNCVTGCAGGSSTPTDAFANPTTAGLQQVFLMGYNGATWDRLRSTIASGLLVNVSNTTFGVTQSTSPWVVSGTVTANAGTNLNTSALLLDATFTGRLPTAYVDADTIANQTTTAIHGQCYFYNGATWDRCRGSVANGLTVSVSNATLAVTQSGAWSTGRTWTLASGTDSVAAVQSGAWSVGVTNAFLLDATFTNRFPAGSTPADNESNAITATRFGNYNFIFDGVAWDRWTGAVSQSGTWNIGTVTTVTSITNPVTVAGDKTNNNAAPGATNVGVLPCIATAAAPSSIEGSTEGNQVGCSTNLSGATRVINESSIATANNDGACASGAASFTVAASNASRTWLAMWASPANTDDVYIKLGATATSADARFAPGQPLNFTAGRIYTGIVDAFPASGTQAVCVMELN
jgi:hypothetical protein